MGYILDGVTQAFVLLGTGDASTWSAVQATLTVTSFSIGASVLFGVPLGLALGLNEFPGKRALRLLVDTLLSLPTVAIGLICYALLSRRGPLGDLGLLFTLPGVAIGQTILALPIVVALVATAVEGLDARLRPTLLTLGALPRQALMTELWEMRFSVALAVAAAYGRVATEIGISMMVGGNIKWHTRTITTAITLETGKGEFALGIALGLVLMGIAFGVNLIVAALRRLAG